ncbi:exodeoxyribonuclease VII large subunit [Swingsia samuiensis]|uniref:Exodeoxyribonuclease VII large subunit n=1 Tax=Swingsia samuiensis TaxID=1293412 RepID=A0A4Y6UI92_9PROT|nr:exodeoxyribonuclease VII large subunit [Swingsia samuiensis]QDH16530.1 exodeoxyribonuclease VII large subunit [Swingsia samuiensis]
MDAFPRRYRSDSAGMHEDSASMPVLTPEQVQELFSARLDEMCMHFDEWKFPLAVSGQIGEIVPNTYRKYYQLPLIDHKTGVSVPLEVNKSLVSGADIRSGDHVRVIGALKARNSRGNIVLRFEVFHLEAYEAGYVKKKRDETLALDFLRELKTEFHAYPEVRDPKIFLIHSAASNALVVEDFLQALGGVWRSDRVRALGVPMNDPQRIADAVASCRENLLVIIRGGGDASEFVVFEQPEVLTALASCPAHRILGLGHSANRTLAERVVDYSATTPADAGHYIRRMSGRIWQRQEEARDQAEEIAALRESVTVASQPVVQPWGRYIKIALISLVLGCILCLILQKIL